MSSFNVRVQQGAVASTASEAHQVAKRLVPALELICKAQILAGGRGKGTFKNGYKGGVKVCSTPEEIKAAAENMLNQTLVTKQTGPEGQLCSKVLVHEGIQFSKELYLAILMDRQYNGPVIVYSRMGGMDIEEVAENNSEAIFTEPVDIMQGITDAQCRKIATGLGFEKDGIDDAAKQIKNLYELFMKCDATQVEINPFVIATNGKVYCVDAKINFDDNASFRQKDLFDMRDYTMEDPREVEASKYHLNYIGLNGNIGCMVNGAGLAMATMDIIKLHGGQPANFLDVGGGADVQQISNAFRILNSDPTVQAILVNVFGGIMRCDIIANGIVTAASQVSLNIPLVVRLAGTNADQGNKILEESGLNIVSATDLDDAARKAVKAIKK